MLRRLGRKLEPLIGVSVAIAIAAGPAAAAPTPATVAASAPGVSRVLAGATIGKFASPSYRERDAASRLLTALGAPALPALEAALGHPDPEFRARAGEVYDRVEPADRRARLAALLADPDPARGHGLPAWDAYREITGGDHAAKRVYAEMLNDPATRPVIRAAGRSALAAAAAVTALSQQVLETVDVSDAPADGTVPKLRTDITALLFGTIAAGPSAPRIAVQDYHALLMYHRPDEAMRRGTPEYVRHQLLIRWLGTRTTREDVYDALVVARVFFEQTAFADHAPHRGLVSDLALSVLRDATNYQFERVEYAINVLVNARRLDALPHLRAVFDTRVRHPNQMLTVPGPDGPVEHPMLRCDVALSAAVIITGQDLADYGFDGPPAERGTYVLVGLYGFAPRPGQTADARRAAAFEKWRLWEAAQRGGK